MSGRESQSLRDQLHQVANQILKEARKHDCKYIAFENLKNIRERASPVKEFHQWAHRQLVDPMWYKTEPDGISVEFADPKNTSQRCLKCGHASERNRVRQAEFECESYGATQNADYVGAKAVECY